MIITYLKDIYFFQTRGIQLFKIIDEIPLKMKDFIIFVSFEKKRKEFSKNVT